MQSEAETQKGQLQERQTCFSMWLMHQNLERFTKHLRVFYS